MKHLRIGQSATIWSDYYGPLIQYHGTIAGLPGAAGNVFSLLPPQNLSGNWIKIVQRLPVRIALDPEELSRYPLRLGLSMHVRVNATKSGRMIPVTTTNAPQYETAVFDEEEQGVLAVIQDIIQVNLDPTLAEYRSKPLNLAAITSSQRVTA